MDQAEKRPRKPREVTTPRPTSYDKRRLLSLAEAAELVTEEFFAITEMAIGKWPLKRVLIGSRNHFEKGEVIAYAKDLIAKAEAHRGRRGEVG